MKKHFKEEKTEYDKGLEMVTYQMGFLAIGLIIALIYSIVKSFLR